MRFRCLLYVAALCLLLRCACQDESKKIRLFEDFYYGMSYQDVLDACDATECADRMDSLCRRNPIIFFREIWYQRFNFRRNRLISIDIINLTPAKVAPIINGWLDSGRRFVPVLLSSGGKQLDVFAAMKQAGKEGARRAIWDFYRATSQDLNTDYLYLDLQNREDCLDSMNSYTAILRYGPRDLVGVEQITTDTMCTLTFTAPIAEWQDKGIPQ